MLAITCVTVDVLNKQPGFNISHEYFHFFSIVSGKHPASDLVRNYLDNWLGLTILLIFLNFFGKIDLVRTLT